MGRSRETGVGLGEPWTFLLIFLGGACSGCQPLLHLGSCGDGEQEQEQAADQTLAVPRPATAELLSSLEDLELSNRRLAGENAKLQRSVETAEEGSARLGEEIAALRKQLRRSVLSHPR